MKPVIEVQLRNKYGRELIYPVNQTALDAVSLTGRITFYQADLVTLQGLGFEIVWVPAQLDLRKQG